MNGIDASIQKTAYRRRFIFFAALLVSLGAVCCRANDAAAESAAGGIQLRSERRISMLKEHLYIGKKFIKSDPSNLPNLQYQYPVEVEYQFLNDSDENVVTEVVFPLPEYGYPGNNLIQDRYLHGFEVTVDGKNVLFSTIVAAKIGDKDVTDILSRMNINIKEFGNFIDAQPYDDYQIAHLPIESQNKLKSSGIVDDDLYPLWNVAISYHWKQTFPARKTVNIKHKYDAIAGFSYFTDVNSYLDSLPNSCAETGLRKGLEARQRKLADSKAEYGPMVFSEWVSYILTTANTWKTPIHDFELVVERPEGEFVSFCWDGKVEKISETIFRASAENFVPKHELVIYFLSVK
jgi:hypothetical protein